MLTSSSILSCSVSSVKNSSFASAPIAAFQEFLCNRKFRKPLFELKPSNRLLNGTPQTTSDTSLNSLTHLSNKQKQFGIKFQIKKKDLIKSFRKSFTLNVNVFCMMFMTCNSLPVEPEE